MISLARKKLFEAVEEAMEESAMMAGDYKFVDFPLEDEDELDVEM